MTTSAPFDIFLNPSADTGITGDGRTADPALVIDGLGVAGDTINLDVSGNTFITTVQEDGTWSISTGPLAEGSYNIVATQTEAGVDSDPTEPFTIAIVQPAPSSPTLQSGSDSGSSSADNLTDIVQPTLTGTGVDGDTIALFDTVEGITTQIGSGIVSGGVWSITTNTPLTEGANFITAIQSDAGGNASDPSDGLSITLDTTAATVTSVVASGASITDGNGALGVGAAITLTLTLSEIVIVAGGIPTLSLNDGGTATYLSGSGTDILTFGYTVSLGDNTADLSVTGYALNGATIADPAGNTTDLSAVVTDLAGILQIDTTAPTVDSVATSGAAITVGAGDLGIGEAVTLTLVFNEAVAVSGGVPSLTLNDGGTATYLSGSGTNTLTFGYTVSAGENTADLTISGCALHGATIQDAAGNAADPTAISANPAGTLQIDTTAPEVTSIVASGLNIRDGSGDLGIGAIVDLTVNLGEAVTITHGLPTLTLNNGGIATYVSGSGTDALTFEYTVSSGDDTADLAVTGDALNGATIQDAAGNAADLTNALINPVGTLLIDAIRPTVRSIVASGDTITDGAGDLGIGKSVSLTVAFSEAVTVSGGIPDLTLADGGIATYQSGSGTNALTFSYTVEPGDNTSRLTASGIALNGATILDAVGNAADLSVAVANLQGILRIDTTRPIVNAVTASGDNLVDGDGDLSTGQALTLVVTLSESVVVTGGLPTLILNNGDIATYVSGSGTNVLTFGYTVAPGADTADLAISGFVPNGAAIQDGAGNDADFSGAIVNPTGTLRIDTTAPTVGSIVATGAGIAGGNGDIGIGQAVTLIVSFGEAVTVDTTSGTPTLTLNDGGTATYVSGSGSSNLTFTTVVVPGENAADLTVAGAELNGATIRDAAGNAADLSGTAINPSGTLRIDTTAPIVNSIAASGRGITAGSGDLGVSNAVILTVTFTEAVTVANGVPTLALNDGGTATYVSGSGSNTLVFAYMVSADDNIPDLAVVHSSLNEATIRDGAGNTADLSGAIANPAGILQIDTVAPTLSSVTASGSAITNGNGDLGAAQVVTLTVTFSEAVTVTGGIPTLSLNDGGIASYAGGSGTSALTFAYTIATGEHTSDLAIIGTAHNGAIIQDAAGNAVDLAGAVVNPAGTLQIDTTAPTVTSVIATGEGISSGGGDIGTGQYVVLSANFSETVTVTGGVPALLLNDGGIARYLTGSGTSTLSFGYTVAPGENVADLAIVGSSLNDAAIRDGARNAANTLGATVNPAGVLRVDTDVPTVTLVTASGAGISDGNGGLNAGKSVNLNVNFSESVVVQDGTPTLTLNDGGTATYLSGSGTDVLTFGYTVARGENTGDLTVIAAALDGATIQDSAGNAASLGGVTTNPVGRLQIDTMAPTVVSVGTSGNSITDGSGDVGTGQTVNITLNLSEAVTIAGGAPTLNLNNGSTAAYISGSGTDHLTFRYTVVTGDDTRDLTVVGISLHSAQIYDAVGNTANLAGATTNPAGTLQIDTSTLAAATTLVVTDTSMDSRSVDSGGHYTGPVAGIEHDYITVTSHNLNLVVTTPNWFIHAGSGDDAIDVSQAGGTNVLDGSTGSNFLVGGNGSDTFFLDIRGLAADVWSTIEGFHPGDTATIWGVTPNDFTVTKYDNKGAAGHTGLDFSLTAASKPNANLTLVGYSIADLSNGRLTVSYGTTPDMSGAPGSTYMMIHGN